MTAQDALRAVRARAHAVPASAFRLHAGEMTQAIALAFGRSAADVHTLVEALEAVLAAHSPGNVRLETLGFDFDADEYRTRIVTSCAGCHHEHPCPTVTAIETALEGGS